jgi:predicted ATP-dependent endonuclease of OLD family
MGSGIKTILQVLMNLIVIPKIEKKPSSDYVFEFEELENNLHPSMQRRLFNYINQYATKNSTYFFITTHSNVVIDIFSSINNAQIIHIENNKSCSVIHRCLSYLDNKHILEDLEVKASDLLQCNGIIWVEGPSDRVYLKKWINLTNSEWIEGLHYLIVFYGGKLLSNLKFDFYENDLIPLLKVNKNSAVMIDRDGSKIDPRLNKTKLRIQKEIGECNCWITKGREIENYLSNKTITTWLEHTYRIKSSFKQTINTKLGDSIKNAHNKIKIDYEKNKPMFAREIIKYIDNDDLNMLDLKYNMESLNNLIKQWNSVK